jgi:SAM-dependent methyltransferase
MKSGDLLYVGIAGDPKGGEYSSLFSNFNITTFDVDPVWNPDIIGDITKTQFDDNSWDVIVCVQVIEHIPNLWDLPKEINRILKPNGYAIIDCPWMYPYHAEPPSFGDYWRVSKDGMKILFKDFELVQIYEGTQNTSCLIRKI